jgi:hypothetical protein
MRARALTASALLVATAALACTDLNTAYSTNGTASPLVLQFPAQFMWAPYFNLQVNGAAVASLTTTCPSITRKMVMTSTGGGSAGGGQLMSLQMRIPLFSSFFGSGMVVDVYACDGSHLSTVYESFDDSWVNAFSFSNRYRIVDAASGAQIGNTDGSRLGDGQISVFDNAGTQVGMGAWDWHFGGSLAGNSVRVTQWSPGPASSSPARAETMLALMSIGFLRAIGGKDSKGSMDACSGFVIVGVPMLALFQLCFTGMLVASMRRKLVAAALSLLLYPGSPCCSHSCSWCWPSWQSTCPCSTRAAPAGWCVAGPACSARWLQRSGLWGLRSAACHAAAAAALAPCDASHSGGVGAGGAVLLTTAGAGATMTTARRPLRHAGSGMRARRSGRVQAVARLGSSTDAVARLLPVAHRQNLAPA